MCYPLAVSFSRDRLPIPSYKTNRDPFLFRKKSPQKNSPISFSNFINETCAVVGLVDLNHILRLRPSTSWVLDDDTDLLCDPRFTAPNISHLFFIRSKNGNPVGMVSAKIAPLSTIFLGRAQVSERRPDDYILIFSHISSSHFLANTKIQEEDSVGKLNEGSLVVLWGWTWERFYFINLSSA